MYTKEQLIQKGYEDDQIVEILYGQRKKLDISHYIDIEFMAIQMREIRLGLEAKLPVDLYAKKELDWLQMMEVRKGLISKVDAKLYANSNIPYDKMREIRKGLECDMNLLAYIDYDAGIIRQIRKSIGSNIDIMPFVHDKYDQEQLEIIRDCLINGIDIYSYINNELRGEAIKEIALGLKMHLDVVLYADVKYSWQQMRQIRKGLQNRVDITKYYDVNYTWQQMREIRKGLERGLDVSQYSSFMYTANEMHKKRMHMWGGMLELEDEASVYGDDQKLEITVSPDEMEAFLAISELGMDFTVDEIVDELHKFDIIEGINLDEIEHALSDPYNQYLVAEGTNQRDGKDGYNEYFFDIEGKRQPKILEDGSVDYAHSEWYKCVAAGEVVAKYHEATPGTDGTTVRGRTISANKGKELGIHEMEGCKLLDDKKTYVATINGKVELKGNKLIVTSMFELDEVNPSIGNIDFNGDVIVKGNVGAGSVINATGDIFVQGFVEGAEITAGGSVEIGLGVNASNKGFVKAENNVSSKYFENAIIIAGKDISTNNILNSNVRAGGKIIVNGRRGSITGGTTYAFEGIESENLGNIARMDTDIRMGIDDEIMQKYNRILASISDIEKEIQILNSAHEDIQRKHPPEVRNVMDMFIKIEKAIVVKKKHLQDAFAERDCMERDIEKARGCKAIVKGNIYEGVVISIDSSTWRSPGIRNATIEKKTDKSKVSVTFKEF
ncbi:MAG: DUF342 domain-containing protein [Lachnospiraceae bacterium]|nr:DUF342 domain-containing protein [Lachnospiraceae bacterium]